MCSGKNRKEIEGLSERRNTGVLTILLFPHLCQEHKKAALAIMDDG
jgi:hypothetical protein